MRPAKQQPDDVGSGHLAAVALGVGVLVFASQVGLVGVRVVVAIAVMAVLVRVLDVLVRVLGMRMGVDRVAVLMLMLVRVAVVVIVSHGRSLLPYFRDLVHCCLLGAWWLPALRARGARCAAAPRPGARRCARRAAHRPWCGPPESPPTRAPPR